MGINRMFGFSAALIEAAMKMLEIKVVRKCFMIVFLEETKIPLVFEATNEKKSCFFLERL